jgi:hypothetical protein
VEREEEGPGQQSENPWDDVIFFTATKAVATKPQSVPCGTNNKGPRPDGHLLENMNDAIGQCISGPVSISLFNEYLISVFFERNKISSKPMAVLIQTLPTIYFLNKHEHTRQNT